MRMVEEGIQQQERGEWIGFGLYQSCGNRGSVECVSVFGLRWCGWGCVESLDQWSGSVG